MKDRSFKIDSLGAKSDMPKSRTHSAAAETKKSSFDSMLNSSMKAISSRPIIFKKTLFNPDIPVIPTFATADTGFKGSLKIVMKNEGHTYVKNDGMRGPSRMGILQSTAREYGYKGDIRNITPAQTEGIYKKIWEKSGAAGLPYPLSAIHFDTYVNSPAAARKILKQSGGDINTYLSMREDRYSRLATLRPERFAIYRKGWMNRISSLRNVAAEYAKASGSNKIA